MVERFNLIDVYDSRDVEYAIKDFESNMNLKVTDEGALSISIFDNIYYICSYCCLLF